jgi:hypothetical protein
MGWRFEAEIGKQAAGRRSERAPPETPLDRALSARPAARRSRSVHVAL